MINENDPIVQALNHAIAVIESYQMDIRNSEWTGVNLRKRGFCQGSIYMNAIGDILNVAGVSMNDPYRKIEYFNQLQWNYVPDNSSPDATGYSND